VYDYAKVLVMLKNTTRTKKLIKYADTTTTQIVVITIESLKGEDIGFLQPKWAQEWGIGTEKNDNGVLILLAKAEKNMDLTRLRS
jgi:uncharacterized protein